MTSVYRSIDRYTYHRSCVVHDRRRSCPGLSHPPSTCPIQWPNSSEPHSGRTRRNLTRKEDHAYVRIRSSTLPIHLAIRNCETHHHISRSATTKHYPHWVITSQSATAKHIISRGPQLRNTTPTGSSPRNPQLRSTSYLAVRNYETHHLAVRNYETEISLDRLALSMTISHTNIVNLSPMAPPMPSPMSISKARVALRHRRRHSSFSRFSCKRRHVPFASSPPPFVAFAI